MRIGSHIFISVFLATVLPLVALALAASYYTEYNYQHKIKHEIIASLNGISAEVSQQLRNSRNLTLGISRANAIKSFLPVLNAIEQGKNHHGIKLLRENINHYFEGFQTILLGDFTIRVLDRRGDTLVKVTHNKTSQPQYENLLGIHYVEPQISANNTIQDLQHLPAGEVSFISLPQQRLKNDHELELPLLDYAVPLYQQQKWLGTLVVTLSGQQIDSIVNNATRLYKGKLIIAENNPDNSNRHGLLIYDEKNNLHVAGNRSAFFSLQKRVSPFLFNEVIDHSEGLVNQNDSAIYFTEFFPYPTRLVGWLIATQVNQSVLSEPFTNSRLAIWLFAATALLFTLIFTSFAVRKISQPICQLASQLKSFADGKHEQRANSQQSITEIKALSSSFNYMADTLINAQGERDKAQNMVLQSNKLASIGQMAAGIGHEINNPLNNILSYSKLISRNIAKNAANIESKNLTRLQSDIDALRNETLRASEIIKGILNFARQMPPQLETFSIYRWLQKSISLVQQMTNARHISVNMDYDSKEEFKGDQAQLQQVVINLLLNAIQASADNTVIDISVNVNEEYLKVMITDHGSGIAEGDLNKIYDPFFSTKEEGEGSGLGLSISLGIIESHHGTLLVENNCNSTGTTATLFLPSH